MQYAQVLLERSVCQVSQFRRIRGILQTLQVASLLVDVVSISFTDGADMDSVAAGEAFRLKVTRDGVSDTAAGDAELMAVEIRET